MILFRELKNEIINSNSNVTDILKYLSEIDQNTIFIGTGGSKVVSEFAARVIGEKNNIITCTLDARDLHYKNVDKYHNIFIASYSGSNYGVKNSFLEDKDIYLLSSRKTNIASEVLLHYDMNHVNSFISLEASIIPMSILLHYYLGDKFGIILEEIFKCINESLSVDINGEFVNIFTGVDTSVSAIFLESSLTEAGMYVPLMHEKYSYCHGRSTINRDKDSSTIYLRYLNNDLDNAIKESLPSSFVYLESKFEDSVIDDFYLTLQCMYLLMNLAKKADIDLRNIAYDKKAVKKLYYFKGSM